MSPRAARRVLVLTHADLVPPPGARPRPAGRRPVPWGTELDLLEALRRLGCQAWVVGLNRTLAPLQRALRRRAPEVVVNLLEEFRDRTRLAPGVIAWLERRGVPVTGCPAAALRGAHDKLRAKRRLAAAGLAVAEGRVLRRGARMPARLPLPPPLVVKSLTEHGSVGLTQASVVGSVRALAAQARHLFRRVRSDALVERYVEGRELYVAVLAGRALPPCELRRASPAQAPWIASERTKWDPAYQRAHGLSFGPAGRLEAGARRRVLGTARRAARALGVQALARVDLRLTADGTPWVIEVNANPDVCSWGETATSAGLAGLAYDRFVGRLLDVALTRAARSRRGAAPRGPVRAERPRARGRRAPARPRAAGSPARTGRR